MKKIAILALFSCCITAAYSQDCFDKIATQAVAIDSLQKKLSLEKGISEQKLQAANDSITRLITAHTTEISNFKTKIGKLESDTANLNKQIKKLDKNNINKLESQLNQKTDSISQLKVTIIAKDNRISVINEESIKKEEKKYAEGQQNVYREIGSVYESKSFDDLIISSTKQSVERDLLLIGDNNRAKQKLQNLKNYFDAHSILEKKFDAQKLQNAQSQLHNITDKSALVDELNKSIKDYELCSTALKKKIIKIIEIDKILIVTDDYTQEMILKEILYELAWYFRNYHFNFTEYPYLSDIVLEIMNLKQKDADADISDFLSKL